MPLAIFMSTSQILLNFSGISNKYGAPKNTQLFNKCPGNAKSKQEDYSMASVCHTSINTSQDHVSTFNNSTRLLTHIQACFYFLRTCIIIPFLVSAWFFVAPPHTHTHAYILFSLATFLNFQGSVKLFSCLPYFSNTTTKIRTFFSNFQIIEGQ